MKIQKSIVNLFNQFWMYPLLLFVIGMISYVISYPPLGFYWDDWQAVFLYQNQNIQIMRDFFVFDRPFSSWTYEVVFPLLSMKPLVWQIFTMLLRVLAIWSIVGAFELIWSGWKNIFRWTGALLLVFPSFTMQSISVAFNQHFFTLFLFGLSIFLMIKSVQSTSKWRWFLYGTSILLSGLHIFTMEYYVGLEILRPFLLFFLFDQSFKNETFGFKLKRTLVYYLPFLFVIFCFLYWRILIYPQQFIINSSVEDPNTPVLLKSIIESPLKTSIKLANLILQDSIYLLFHTWLRTLEPLTIRLDAVFNILSWVVGLTMSGIFLLWSNKTENNENNQSGLTRYMPLVVTGFLALIVGGLPIWIMNRQILIGKWSDRFSLAPMVGAVLLIVLFVDWIVRSKRQKNIVLLVILGLSIAFQMRTTHKYALDWTHQNNFYWQLFWRVPAVKSNTAFFSAIMPSNYSSDFSVGFSINTLYAPENKSTVLSHWYFDPGGTGLYFNQLDSDQEVYYNFRNLEFKGNTSNAIAYMYRPASGCLLVLDDAYLGNPNMDAHHEELIKLNNYDSIDLERDPDLPNENVFGKEPEHDWCYYFQKADFARQHEDWNQVIEIMESAKQLGLEPNSGVERMPAMEAYFYRQDWSAFIETGKDILNMDDYMDRFLCVQWDRLASESDTIIPQDVKAELKEIVDCSQPFKQ